jgi:hypothetical protein
VFCPSCGSNKKDEVKFCTRCGTNLGVVSDALSGRTTGALETDERTVSLLKDYYRSRRMMIIGAAVSAVALFKLAGPFLLGFPEKMIPIVILSLLFLFLSLFAFIWGLIKWNNSGSEIKALGISPSKGKALASAEQSRLAGEQLRVGKSTYATDPIPSATSVTEQTTHLLDEDEQTPRSEPHFGGSH